MRQWLCALVMSSLILLAAAGPAPADSPSLFVASTGTAQVLRYDGGAGTFLGVFVTAGSGGLSSPRGVAFGPDGNLYVAGQGSNGVLRYSGATGAFLGAFVLPGSGALTSPIGLTFGPDGNLYVASFGNNRVLRFSGATGAFIDTFVASDSGGLNAPTGLAFGRDGNLYAVSQGTQEILRFNGTTGAFIDTFVTVGSGGLNTPFDLAFGPDGNLYVTSFGSNQVLRYNGATGAFINIFVTGGSGGLSGPIGLAFGPDGNLYVASASNHRVLRYNGGTGAFIDIFVPAGSGGLSIPSGLVFSPPALVAAVLPGSRSVQVGSTATAFATVINAGLNAGLGCRIAPQANLAATFLYQTTDPATNALVGTANTAVNIPAGALQTFLIAFTPSGPFDPIDVPLAFTCTNSSPAAVVPGLDTLLLSASGGPVPDVVALAATTTNDGIANIPGNTGTGFFAVATVNVGAADSITVSADTGTVSLPVNLFLCQTNSVTGACLQPPSGTVTVQINHNDTPTFAVFAAGTNAVAFDPAHNRVFVRFKDPGGITRGSTSVAVRTQP